MTSAFAEVIRLGAAATDTELVLVDAGPSLGAINRAVMVASDHVVVPLAPDLYSVQSLPGLGIALTRWRAEWVDRTTMPLAGPHPQLPGGSMVPDGYIVVQRGVRVDRAVGPYDRWLGEIPAAYGASVLQLPPQLSRQLSGGNAAALDDPACIGLVKHYHGLVAMAREARKPVFLLRSADGAMGAHQHAVLAAYGEFRTLTERVLDRVGLGKSAQA